MTATWQKAKLKDETCPGCESVYEVVMQSLAYRDKDMFRCEVCNHVMKEWKETAQYEYTLKKRGAAGGG